MRYATALPNSKDLAQQWHSKSAAVVSNFEFNSAAQKIGRNLFAEDHYFKWQKATAVDVE